MRFGTFQVAGVERFGLVVRDPHEGQDWIFDPSKIEKLADDRLRIKGAPSPWYRPRFADNRVWPLELSQFLALGQAGMDSARRMYDFIQRYMDQGDPFALRSAGVRVADASMQAPIPRPRLLLGVVGNSAGFMRMDVKRGRNLHQPSCHQRTQTSVVGPGQPVVMEPGSEFPSGTTEMGVVIGSGGRDITKAQALHHVAGYTVINDLIHPGYAQRWDELDSANAVGARQFHFYTENTSSWLSKLSDTMCPMGPFLVTGDEVGDPYDLMCYYREGGILRNRAHSGALCTSIEELIYWLSQFITLEPGMVLHMGAMGQDGFELDKSAELSPDYYMEAEIEKIGSLRNPIVQMSHADRRGTDGLSHSMDPTPVVRELVKTNRASIALPDDWDVTQSRHFWTLVANDRNALALQGIAPKPYPLAYNVPSTALAASGVTVQLPPRSRTLTGTCELGLVLKSLTHRVTRAEAKDHILGYVVVAVLRDSSFADSLVQPHLLNAYMTEIYNRWNEACNVVSLKPLPMAEETGRSITFAIDQMGEISSTTDEYLLDGATVISEISGWITLLPGDVISLGRLGTSLTIPADRHLPPDTRMTATIEGIGTVSAYLDDKRATAVTQESVTAEGLVRS